MIQLNERVACIHYLGIGRSSVNLIQQGSTQHQFVNCELTIDSTGLHAEDSSPSTSQSDEAMPKMISWVSLQETTNIVPQAAAQNTLAPVPMFHAFPSYADVAVNTNNSIKKDASTDTPKFSQAYHIQTQNLHKTIQFRFQKCNAYLWLL